MPFQKIITEKLSSSVTLQIEKLILRGILRPGDRLPAERELAERFGVSRPDYGELKSFFVEPQFRGNGIASLIMQEILRTSRELNINSLKLETGIGLDNALNLYKRFNFELCEPFGKYFENGFSIFMKRDLP